MDRLFTDGYVDHDPSRAGLPPGPEGIRIAWSMMRAAFPDLQVTIEDAISGGGRLAVRGEIRGTHRGELMGIPPAGQWVTGGLIDIDRVENGRLAERWGQADTLGIAPNSAS